MIKYSIIFALLCSSSLIYAGGNINNTEIIAPPDEFYYDGHDTMPDNPSWKRTYTPEERMNAKTKMNEIPENAIHRNESREFNYSRTIDLTTGKLIPTPERELYNDLTPINEDYPEEYEVPGSIELNSTQEPLDEMAMSSNRFIYDTMAYPVSAAVKLYVTALDGNRYACSGTMIGPSVLLTAAHCTHDGEFGWYSGFEIIPAMNQRNTAGTIINREPFGVAHATKITSWKYSFTTGNVSSDMAIVELDRPVGALSSWMGYGTGTYCDILTNNNYSAAGYPAADTRQDHCDMYNGSQMVEHHGTFDQCGSGRAYISPDVSCGGQSGSGYLETQRKAVRVILSGSIVSQDIGFGAIIDKFEFDEITKFKHNSLSPIPDVAALGISVNGSLLGTPAITVQSGTALQDLRFKLLNNSQNTYTGNMIATYYLSPNPQITDTDTSLGSYQWSAFTLSSAHSINALLVTPPTIPANIPDGIYYIGVIVNRVSSETNIRNNVTGTEDVAIIRVETNNVPSYLASTKTIIVPLLNNDGVGYKATLRVERSTVPLLFSLRSLTPINENDFSKYGTAIYTAKSREFHMPVVLINGVTREMKLWNNGKGLLSVTYFK